MRNLLATLCFFGLTTVHAVTPNPWGNSSNPDIMSKSFERNFEKLPLQASSANSHKLWASDYWPRNRGGINYRWNSPKPIGFDLVSPSKAQVLAMSQEELATLAASEKFDLLNGDYSYTLKREVNAGASPRAPLWNGICNGWAPASINHNEPTPKTLVNADGVKIPFGSSDIKAILSYYYAFKNNDVNTRQMGRRCNFNIGPNCSDDLNAGAFHIVLTNKVGIQNSSFVMDVVPGRPVWNHAPHEYITNIVNPNLAPNSSSAKGTVKRVHLTTVVTYIMEIKANNWNPVHGTDQVVNDTRNYEYTLDVDANGNIIGGEWISAARPDFMWTMDKVTTFKGSFARLSDLLND